MKVRITTSKKAIMTLKAFLFSWKTTALGLASVIYGVFQVFSNQDTTLTLAIHDQKLWMALIVAIMGFVAKDNTAHGTPSAPIPPTEAAQIAAVAATIPPASAFVGGLVPGSIDIYTSLPGDLTPVGQSVVVAGVSYKKITAALYQKQS